MKLNNLQKTAASASLVSFAIVLDIFWTLTFSWNTIGSGTIFKISVLPLILIGFIFGFKYGLLSCILFNFYHLQKASFFTLKVWLDLFNINSTCSIFIYLLDYTLPDLSYSISGLFYLPDFNNNNHFKKICLALFLIFSLKAIFHILSGYLFWINLTLTPEVISKFPNFFRKLLDHKHYLIFSIIYNFIPTITTGLLNGVIFYFLNNKFRFKLF
ncbi:putative thiamine transporter protein, ThiA/YuaJ family [Candidatus Phytoplasma mali]|uniref:Putative thiamine transporter protein, ThiA/YuaJ family n=1 Tax=Phytoplasma mali (strain AT) TaxID=482235 RepID=B3QZV9_PHYMT|nr:energy-coupled thiamine transporter ThiT [Candidatus Phytoplasma mali]CAP18496.1 putative thiamine transporter protein, ThiA/YuaJ family [Candidatus Phytoplasma mali]